ncbi:MAG TPA: asparaginase [Candidatus Udaeobacter sp.]|jgi:L-asparaginase II|nr:asparaginase [Candidatus Udaeobacter sp.]
MVLELDVIVWRGAILESRHRVQAVAADARGRSALSTPEPDLVTTFRSAAKPFQALPLVERGHLDRWNLSDEDLAVICASHTGSPEHVARVRGILGRIGQDESALACGYHDPLDPVSLEYVRSHPEARSPVYNNCSGKHAGMLCLALSEGWPVRGYERLDHPLQQLMRRTVGEACGMDPDSLGVAVDGCSVPVFALPLSAMARGYANLASARPEQGPRPRALDRIRRAMTSYPRMTGGAGRLSTDLMEAAPGKLCAKGGAEGLECLALTDSGLGIAVKSEDGNARPLGPAVLSVLDQLGALDGEALEKVAALRRPLVRNVVGLEVGRLEARVTPPLPAVR